jgi:hypothetical protein
VNEAAKGQKYGNFLFAILIHCQNQDGQDKAQDEQDGEEFNSNLNVLSCLSC